MHFSSLLPACLIREEQVNLEKSRIKKQNNRHHGLSRQFVDLSNYSGNIITPAHGHSRFCGFRVYANDTSSMLVDGIVVVV